jgi:hypothetical protein
MGQRRRGAVTSVCGPSQSDVTCCNRPGDERQRNQPKDLTSQGFEVVLSGEGNHPAGLQRSARDFEIFRRGLASVRDFLVLNDLALIQTG